MALRQSRLRPWAPVSLLLAMSGVLAGVAAAGDYQLERKIPLGGEGGWDYLSFDGADHRLYVTHASRTLVLDTRTDKLLGEIPGSGVHGVALAHDLGRGFITNGRDGSVTIFDLETLKALAQVAAGSNPDAILYEPATRRVFAFNGRSHDATVIDGTSGRVLSTIPLGGKPEFAATDAGASVYVNIEDTAELVTLDARTLKVTRRHSLSPCTEPTGLAMDVAHRRLFAACGNRMLTVVDAQTGKVVTSVPTGDGTDAVAFDPAMGLIYSSNGEGTLTLIHADTPDRYSLVGNVTTAKGARTMALDPESHRVYLATAQFGPPPQVTPEQPHPRPSIVAGTFALLVLKPSSTSEP